ncbi:MAG: multidrug efflux SMR transporter [Candidatus Pristimantibacillus sp.]
MKGYFALGIAVISEIIGTSMLKLSNGFTNLIPSIVVIVAFVLAFYFLSISLRVIPLSLAYAIWSGVGTAITALIGILVWDEAFSASTLAGLVLIIGGVLLLNSSKKPEKEIAVLD